MISEKTSYQRGFEIHWTAILGIVRYLITQFADESVEVAARAVALAAPLPNAINMYNVGITSLGWGPAASFAFAMTLEIVVFLLVEIALLMWDGYLSNCKRYTVPLGAAVAIVLVAVAVVMRIVYVLEVHKIMALLPVVSLCSFVGIGLKRWNERNQSLTATVKPTVKRVKPAVKLDTVDATIDTADSVKFTPTKVDSRRQTLLDMLEEIDGYSVDSVNKSALAKRLDVSRPTLLSDIAALQSDGRLTLNGHVKINK